MHKLMCESGKCVLAITYPNSDASIACDEVCFYNHKKLKEKKEELEVEMKTIIDMDKIKRKR